MSVPVLAPIRTSEPPKVSDVAATGSPSRAMSRASEVRNPSGTATNPPSSSTNVATVVTRTTPSAPTSKVESSRSRAL